ncbi:MAG: ATP-binding protein [Desulfuromonadales bacterium]
MNLKNRFRIIIFSMMTLLVSIALIVGIGIRHADEHIQQVNSVDDLIVDLYELRILNSEYVTTPSERVRQQWRIKYKLIANSHIEQHDIPRDVQDAIKGVEQIFEHLVALPDSGSAGESSQKRLRNQVVTTLNLETQRIIDWASEISRQAKDSILRHLMLMGATMLAVMLVAACATTTTMLVTVRRILTSINRLKEGAEEIAGGRLGFMVEYVGNDEIASLSTAINRMSCDLKDSYENLHEQTIQLENEMAERQQTHEALQNKTAALVEEIEEREATQQSLEEQTAALEEEVAERIRIQEEHDHLEEQLRQSQKMEAIGLLAGGVAHDFNNILSVIMGYGEMLIRRLPAGAEHDNAIQILKASERAEELTRGLLAFSSKQTFRLERTDINQLAADNTKFLKRVIGEDIELVTMYHPAPLYILLDRSQIQQVLMNLATNARDAMPSGGKLTISITGEKPDDAFSLHHSNGSPGAHAVIRVSDTGTGIDKKTVERIFEPFFTTKEKGKGTGLGLSIIHGIIAQHNGFINCSSRPGAGTTFTIYLPLCEESWQTANSAANSEIASLCGSETILLAEDDRMLMEMVTSSFEANGYRVYQAYDGAEAVEIFRKHGDEIDLVILDAIMPKTTGKQAWNEISSLRPDVKACFVSGYTNEILSGKLAVDVSVPFVSKPVKPGNLLQKVREILDGDRGRGDGNV